MTSTLRPAAGKRPPGRRTGDSGTREAILDAARALFAEHGYEGTSVRAIAAGAGVDPALIRHFFQDKQSLFAVTVADRMEIAGRISDAVSGDARGRGRRVTDVYLRLWEDEQTGPILLALVRSAMTSDHAAGLLRDVLTTRMHREAAGPGHPAVQAQGMALAASHLFGVAVARHLLGLPELAKLSHDDLVDAIAPTVERYLRPPPSPEGDVQGSVS